MEAIREDWAKLRGGTKAPEKSGAATPDADATRAMLDAQTQTAEERAAASLGRERAMARLKDLGRRMQA